MSDSLPLGSVVKIKYTEMKAVIIGYNPTDPNTDDKYDYICVDQFFGALKVDNLFAIKKDLIEDVEFYGYDCIENE